MRNSSNNSQLQDGWDPNACILVQREVTSHREGFHPAATNGGTCSSPTPLYHLHTQPLSTPRSKGRGRHGPHHSTLQ